MIHDGSIKHGDVTPVIDHPFPNPIIRLLIARLPFPNPLICLHMAPRFIPDTIKVSIVNDRTGGERKRVREVFEHVKNVESESLGRTL